MRISTLLKLVFALMALVVFAAIVAILVFDPNEYKGEIVAAVERQTGRDFAVTSDIQLKLGLTPSFAVSGVQLANAPWGSRPQMATVGEFAVEVALVPLILGDLQINRLVLRDADILLESGPDGRNFDFAGRDAKKQVRDDDARIPQINDVLVENSVVTFIDGAAGATTTLAIERFSAKADSLSAPLVIDLVGVVTLDKEPIAFTVAGKLGAPKLLFAGGTPYAAELTATALGLTARIGGTVANPLAAKGFALGIEVTGADLRGLTNISGGNLPAAGPIVFAVSFNGDADNATFDDLALKIGQTDVAGRGSIDLRGSRPRIAAVLLSDQLDLSDLLPSDTSAAGSDPRAPGAAPATARAGDAGKVFSAEPLPFAIMQAIDANVEFAFAKLVLAHTTLLDAEGTLVLDNGALAIKPLGAKFAGSELTSTVGVDTRGSTATVAIEIKGQQLEFGDALRELAGLDNLRGRGAVDIALRGTGGSIAEIMATLNGHSRLLMDSGEMRNEFLGNISGLSQTVGEAFGKKEWIVVECIASDFDIADGIARSRINVVNTELLLITTEGQVDLRQEKPDLKVSPQPKGIDLSLAVPVNIGGSLAHPTFTPDTLATARKIGGILGAVAFPPAAIIGLGEMGSSDNACLQTAASGGAAPPQPRQPATPLDSATDAAKDALEGVGQGLKKLFGN